MKTPRLLRRYPITTGYLIAVTTLILILQILHIVKGLM